MYYLFSLILFVPIAEGQLPSVDLANENLDDQITQLFNNCKCVIFYQCDEENFIIPENEIPNRRVPTNINNLRPIKRTRCSNEYYYCCRKKIYTTTVEPTRVTYVYNPNPNYPLQRPNSTTQVQQSVSTSMRNNRECGQQNVNGRTVIDEFPWIVSIRQRGGNNTQYKCGGSLIHPYVVLTAQHCVASANAESLIITAQCNQIVPNHEAIIKSVRKIIKHHEYYSAGLYSDISLLILKSPIYDINPVCLPNSYSNFDGQKCYAAGWGNSVSQKKDEILRKVDLPIVNSDQCVKMLRKTVLGGDFELDSSFICAGGEEGKDTCSGDGGGPLMCLNNNQYIQAGIVSWGLRCGQAGIPSMYTSVSIFSNWIDQQLAHESITIKRY